MSEVIERDLTTANGLYAEQRRLAELAGRHVAIGVCSQGAEVYIQSTQESGGADYKFIRAPTFAEAIAEAETHISAMRTVRQNTIVRRMALAIISIVDEHAVCTVTLLRGKGFSEKDIAEYSDKACDRASEMAGNSPFVVEAK